MRWRPLALLLFFAASLLAAPPPSLLLSPAAPRVGSLAAAALATDPQDSGISHRGGSRHFSLLSGRAVCAQPISASWFAAFQAANPHGGNVASQTNALGHTTQMTYVPGTPYMASTTDALGHTTSYTYDTRGNQLSMTDALGQVTSMTYDSLNNVTSVTQRLRQADGSLGPAKVVSRSTYDGAGRLTRSEDATGHAMTYSYNTNGKMTGQSTTVTVLDPVSGASSVRTISSGYAYDTRGNLRTVTDALGHATTFDYDANGNQTGSSTTRTMLNGSTMVISSLTFYDAQNRVTATVAPDGQSSQTVYDARGKPERVISFSAPDANGIRQSRTTSFTYNTRGELTATAYPDGTSDSSTYDADGRVLTRLDRAGHTMHYRYDVLGRMLSTTLPDGALSGSTSYDPVGRVSASTDERGATTRFAYDAIGRRTSVTAAAVNGISQISTFAYADGNLTAVTDPAGRTMRYAYDLLNRRTHVALPDGTFTQTTYDELGRRLAERDQAGISSQFFYDDLGRLTHVKDALGQLTRYTYDETGQQQRQIDANGHTTTYEYDVAGRRVQRTLPGGQSETMAYTTFGQLAAHTDFNGKTTTFSYEAITNRLLSRIPDPSLGEAPVSYAYYPDGRRLSMTDTTGTWTYQYDLRNRLTRKASSNPNLGALNYGYTGPLLTQIKTDHGTQIDYDHDELGRITSATSPGVGGGAYSYNEVGNLENVVYSNGLGTTYGFDDLNRLKTVTTRKVSDLSQVASYAYTLGVAGNRTALSEQLTDRANRNLSWSYDSLYRLQSEIISGAMVSGTTTYTHDSVGNRLTRVSSIAAIGNQNLSGQYDANDRLTGQDTYDANGNTKVAAVKGMGTVTDAYTFDNRVKTRTLADGSTVELKYDGEGNKVCEIVTPSGGPAQTTWFLIDTMNPTGYAQTIEEIRDGGVAKRYVVGLDMIAQQTTGMGARVLFMGYDGHGSVRYLSDASGTLLGARDYDAFGITLANDPLGGGTGISFNECRLGYAGEEFVPALGQYYNRARILDTERGRFWTQDTWETDESKYAYGKCNPIKYIDPSGHVSFSIGEMVISFSIATYLWSVAVGYAAGKVISAAQALYKGQSLSNISLFEASDLLSLIPGAAFTKVFGPPLKALLPLVQKVGGKIKGALNDGLGGTMDEMITYVSATFFRKGLGNFSTKLGDDILFTENGLRHIMKRHLVKYWNGSLDKFNPTTFWPAETSVAEMLRLVEEGAKQFSKPLVGTLPVVDDIVLSNGITATMVIDPVRRSVVSFFPKVGQSGIATAEDVIHAMGF